MNERRNPAGQTLSEFLAAYDPGAFDRPSVTVDMAVLTETAEVLLIRRGDHPNIGRWALPGGFLDPGESLHQAAARELFEETGLSGIPLTPFGMFGEPTRDPRTRIITCAFLARAKRESLAFSAGDDAAEAALFAYSVQKKGRVALPAKRRREHDVSLPCTACGTPYAGFGTEYEILLQGAGAAAKGIGLSARVAVDDAGTFVLLGGVEGREQLAGDHGLVLFSALACCGLLE